MNPIRNSECSRHSFHRQLAALFLAGLFPLFCFWPVLGGGFLLWDDNVNLIENPILWESIGKSLRWMFTDIESVQRYKPLNWLAWSLLGRSFGLNASVFHALNLFVHAGNAMLLFCIIREFLASSQKTTNGVTLVALTSTLWWALHPLRVEPVAWISGAGYPLSTFFALLSILFFQHYLRNKRSSSASASISFFVLSLLSYPASAALPALLVALALLTELSNRSALRGELRRLSLLILPYCGLAFIVLGATFIAGSKTHQGIWNAPASWESMGLSTRIMQAFAIWEWYLQKTLLPLNLAPVYANFWAFSPINFRAITSVIVIGAISFGTWRIRRRWPECPALWYAFLLMAVPVLGLTQQPFSPSDRYTYLPDIALALLLASLLQRSFASLPKQKITNAVIIVGGCLSATFFQLEMWRSPVTFFNGAIDSVGYRPGAANLHWRLGLHYLSAQQTARAVAEFETVLRLDPNDSEAAHYIPILRARLDRARGKIAPDGHSKISP